MNNLNESLNESSNEHSNKHSNDENLVIQDFPGGKSIYVRSHSNESNELNNKLKIAHNAHNAYVTPSGMSAISTTLTGLLNKHLGKKVNIAYSNQLYCDTPRLFRWLKKLYGCTLYEFDINNQRQDLLRHAQSLTGRNSTDVNILFTESCSNPNGVMFDFSILSELHNINKNWTVIIDNTWLTHVVFNPFEHSHVDFVVMSLTKYYSGGQCIGGAVATRNELQSNMIFDMIRINGLHVSPVNCKIVSDNFELMDNKIHASSHTTVKLLKLLETESSVVINHPFLRKDYSFKIYPSVFTVVLNGVTKSKFFGVMKNARVDLKTSFGYKTSRIDPWPTIKDGKITIRVSVGYEDTAEELYEKLTNIFNDMLSTKK